MLSSRHRRSTSVLALVALLSSSAAPAAEPEAAPSDAAESDAPENDAPSVDGAPEPTTSDSDDDDQAAGASGEASAAVAEGTGPESTTDGVKPPGDTTLPAPADIPSSADANAPSSQPADDMLGADEGHPLDLPFDKRPGGAPQGTRRPTSSDGAPEEEPATDDDDKPREGFSLGAIRVGASGGYALRLHPDERSHGGAATLTVGAPVFAGFGVAADALALGWGPSESRQAPLGFVGASGLLTYVFDDTASTAILGVGPLVGYALELEDDGALTTGLHAGAMLSFGLRFAVAPTVAAEIGIRVPFIVYGPEGLVARIPLTQGNNETLGLFESQFVLTLGLTFDPFRFYELFSAGADPLPLVVPFMAAL